MRLRPPPFVVYAVSAAVLQGLVVGWQYQDVALHRIPEPVIEHDISAYLGYELARIRDSYNSQAFDDQQLPPHWPGKHTQTLVRRSPHSGFGNQSFVLER